MISLFISIANIECRTVKTGSRVKQGKWSWRRRGILFAFWTSILEYQVWYLYIYANFEIPLNDLFVKTNTRDLRSSPFDVNQWATVKTSAKW